MDILTFFAIYFVIVSFGIIFVAIIANYDSFKEEIEIFAHNHPLFRIVEINYNFNYKEYTHYYIEKRFLLFFYKRIKKLYTFDETKEDTENIYFRFKPRKVNYFEKHSDAYDYIKNFLAKPKKTIHKYND